MSKSAEFSVKRKGVQKDTTEKVKSTASVDEMEFVRYITYRSIKRILKYFNLINFDQF